MADVKPDFRSTEGPMVKELQKVANNPRDSVVFMIADKIAPQMFSDVEADNVRIRLQSTDVDRIYSVEARFRWPDGHDEWVTGSYMPSSGKGRFNHDPRH